MLIFAIIMLFALFGVRAVAADEADEAAAALEEGMGYWFGTGPNGYDMQKAEAAFQKAADLGSADAWYWLGELSYYGVEKGHYTQAFQYYQKAADQDSGLGFYGLGALYREGHGVNQDFEKAADYYQKAIDAGCFMGANGLGNLSRIGGGVEEDGMKALEYYMKAAESEDWYTRNQGRLLVGYVYYYGAKGVARDPDKALEWLNKAADEGYGRAYYQLGQMYQYPVAPMKKDLSKSFECYEKAAAYGTTYNLGLSYYGGLGVHKDLKKAVELFLQSADGGRGHIDALAMLSHCYLKGEGVTADKDLAKEYALRCIDAAGIEESEIRGIKDANYGAGLAKSVLIKLGAV